MSLLYLLYYELLEFSEHLRDISEVERQNLLDSYYNKLLNTLRYSAELHPLTLQKLLQLLVVGHQVRMESGSPSHWC